MRLPEPARSVEQFGKKVAVRPGFDLIGCLMKEWINQRGEDFAVGVVGCVEQHGPCESVMAADEKSGGAIQLAVVPRVDAATRIDVADLPAEAVVDGAGFVGRAGKGLTDGLGGEDVGMVGTVEGAGEADEVRSGGDPSAVRVHGFEVPAAVGGGDAFAGVRGEDGVG